MPGAIRGLLRALALPRGRFTSLLLRLGAPTPVEYADILRRSGRFQSIGRDVGIDIGVYASRAREAASEIEAAAGSSIRVNAYVFW
jgi:hypothetical protein